MGRSSDESLLVTMDGEKENKKPQKNDKKIIKRGIEQVDSESSDSESLNEFWPRFLLIQAADKEKPLTRLSPFAILKGIQALAGNPVNVKKLRSGDILVEVSKRSHSTNLLHANFFVNVPVNVTVHKTLNSTKGVIRCRDLLDCTEEEIVTELSCQGVTEAKRISIKRNGSTIKTSTIILTFRSPKLPSGVKCGYLNVPVDVYVPNPLRCFKCQKYGHHRNNCKREAVCAKCGNKDHSDQECNQTPLCVNCNGDHPAFSRDCPMWQKEKAVQAIKYKNNVSYTEARKLIESGQPQQNQPSYASKAKSVRSIACQTSESSLSIQTPQSIPTQQTTSATNTSISPINPLKQRVETNSQTPPTNNKPNIVRPKDSSSNNSKPDQAKSKAKKAKEILTSNRERKGSRFHALRNMDLELALHAVEDGELDELMDVVPETPPSHHPSNSKT